jgi:hypothetical protein
VRFLTCRPLSGGAEPQNFSSLEGGVFFAEISNKKKIPVVVVR